jgi:drug/metabolite transporter (DMT)-like permease
MSLFLGLYLIRRREESFLRVWRNSKREIFTIVFLQNIGYGCFLVALGMSKVSYVVAFRQVSALFGAILGVLYLRESHWRTRVIGALILTAGLVLVGLAK